MELACARVAMPYVFIVWHKQIVISHRSWSLSLSLASGVYGHLFHIDTKHTTKIPPLFCHSPFPIRISVVAFTVAMTAVAAAAAARVPLHYHVSLPQLDRIKHVLWIFNYTAKRKLYSNGIDGCTIRAFLSSHFYFSPRTLPCMQTTNNYTHLIFLFIKSILIAFTFLLMNRDGRRAQHCSSVSRQHLVHFSFESHKLWAVSTFHAY